MRFAICNEIYANWTLARACADIADAGYEGVEIAPFTLAPDPRDLDERRARRLGEEVRAAGLEVVGFHWLLVSPPGLHLTTADDAVRGRTVEFLRHLARLCAAMGGSVLVLGSPRQRTPPAGEDPAAVQTRAIECVRAVCETAWPLGVTLAVEPLAPSLTTFLTTAAEGAELVRGVDHPGCRLHVDVCALASEVEPIADLVRRHAAHLAHFHANDPDLGPPGGGGVDFGPVLRALREGGYDGWVSVEVFRDARPPGETARAALEYLRGKTPP